MKLLEMDKANWKDTTWGEIKKSYPNAQVLESGQDYERPKSWERYDDVDDLVEQYSL